MTTRRPYRESRPLAEALAELRRVAGSQLDPEAVEAFVEANPSERPVEMYV
jgi:HD-GYP domain-containing protein (c-di-GMP phosphodiesterase class II)